MTDKRRMVYAYAEYCPGDFFWGWWLYIAPIVDGKVERERYEWLHRCQWKIDDLNRLIGLPILHDYRGSNHADSTHAFLEKYPNGVVLWEVNGRELEPLAEGEVAPPAWDCLRQVREGQLLDWKNSDDSYLGRREAELAASQTSAVDTPG